MEIKMYVRKCIITRPNTDVIFRPDGSAAGTVIRDYLNNGKLLHKGVDFSEDELTRIDTYIFNSEDDWLTFDKEPLWRDYQDNIIESWKQSHPEIIFKYKFEQI